MPFAEDTTLASKILAGTRGNAGQLTDQVLPQRWISPQDPCLALCGQDKTSGTPSCKGLGICFGYQPIHITVDPNGD